MVGYSISHPQITHTHTHSPTGQDTPFHYVTDIHYGPHVPCRCLHMGHAHHTLYTVPSPPACIHTTHTYICPHLTHSEHTCQTYLLICYTHAYHTSMPYSPPYTSHTHTIHPCHIQRSTHFTHAISILCPPTTYTHHTHATDTYIHTSHAYTYLPTHDKEYMSHIYLPPTYYTHTCTHKHPAHVMSNRAANIQAAVCPPHRSHSLRVPGRPVETHTQAETGLTRADQDPWGHPVLPASAICTRFPGKSHTLTHAQSSRNPSQPRSSKSLRR